MRCVAKALRETPCATSGNRPGHPWRRIRSSQRGRRRCRSSRPASWPRFASVAKAALPVPRHCDLWSCVRYYSLRKYLRLGTDRTLDKPYCPSSKALFMQTDGRRQFRRKPEVNLSRTSPRDEPDTPRSDVRLGARSRNRSSRFFQADARCRSLQAQLPGDPSDLDVPRKAHGLQLNVFVDALGTTLPADAAAFEAPHRRIESDDVAV